jgi:hypothetical protein
MLKPKRNLKTKTIFIISCDVALQGVSSYLMQKQLSTQARNPKEMMVNELF